ncbi:MAG: C40 family peptidase [Candidatus Njordarchaeales archaeon]
MKRIKRLALGTALLTTLTFGGHLAKNIKNVGESTKTSDLVFKSRSTSSKINDIIKTAKNYLGVRYRFGGNTKKGIDCSGFTKAVMKKHGKNLPRTARQQASVGKHINRNNLKAGDLIFFKGTSSHARISHVGIYIGNDKFIHASSGKRKVIITSLSKPYYKKKYFGARRV